jgi:hypothetical protein
MCFKKSLSSSASGASYLRPPPSPGLSKLDLKRYLYVDKTYLLAKILSDDPYYSPGQFLHAPAMRRIGKSTTLKMLAAMARGEKNLFDGMVVNKPGSPFEIGKTPFSVIEIDFSTPSIRAEYTIDQVEASITRRIKAMALRQYGIEIGYQTPAEVLMEWIDKLILKNNFPIVLLIDEYDAPVTTFLSDPKKAEAVNGMLKPFYQAIKGYGDCFHKVFLTGVSKFSSTSMFSGPNQFLPLMERSSEFSSLYGFTDTEIRSTYGKYIEHKFKKPLDEVMCDMRLMYNGYRFHPDQDPAQLLYNPWSVLNYLHTGALTPYWAESSGSSSIISMLGTNAINILQGFRIDSGNLFASISVAEYQNHWKQMAFQSGYATIKNVETSDEKGRTSELLLGYPNDEVRIWLESGMVEYIKGIVDKDLLVSYRESLLNGNLRNAQEILFKIIESQVHKPTNETDIACLALFPLKTVGGDPFPIDIAFECGIRLSEEPVSKGKYPAFDGAVLYRRGKTNVLAVLEIKFTSKGAIENDDKPISQIINRKYADRAKKLFEERSKVKIQKIIKFGISLAVSTSGAFSVRITSDEKRKK